METQMTMQTLVVCRIGLQDYALPLDAALRVVRLPALTAVPDSRPEVCGLINLNGRHLPVIDGWRLVGEPPHYDVTNHIVIIGDDQDHATPALGLLVDEVYGLAQHPSSAIHPLRDNYAGALFCGIIHLEQRSCLVFNVAELRRMVL
jgi:purine-binding chemotaxis protein CheW